MHITENTVPAFQSRMCEEQVGSLFAQVYLSVSKQTQINPLEFHQLEKTDSKA